MKSQNPIDKIYLNFRYKNRCSKFSIFDPKTKIYQGKKMQFEELRQGKIIEFCVNQISEFLNFINLWNK